MSVVQLDLMEPPPEAPSRLALAEAVEAVEGGGPC
jgi:hypothetical protein